MHLLPCFDFSYLEIQYNVCPSGSIASIGGLVISSPYECMAEGLHNNLNGDYFLKSSEN